MAHLAVPGGLALYPRLVRTVLTCSRARNRALIAMGFQGVVVWRFGGYILPVVARTIFPVSPHRR